METSNGLPLEQGGGTAAHDASAVAALRQAGAVVFGKSNLPAGSMDVQTFNPRFGVTVNPYDVQGQSTAGGSNGGNAASIAAGV